MDPASSLSAGTAVYKTFMETYKFLDSDSEKEKLEESTIQAVKKFVFFYEDTHWSEITGEQSEIVYRNHIGETADGFREIAVKIDGKLSEETVESLRKVYGEMERIAMENMSKYGAGTMGGPSRGAKLKEQLQDQYEECKSILDDLES